MAECTSNGRNQVAHLDDWHRQIGRDPLLQGKLQHLRQAAGRAPSEQLGTHGGVRWGEVRNSQSLHEQASCVPDGLGGEEGSVQRARGRGGGRCATPRTQFRPVPQQDTCGVPQHRRHPAMWSPRRRQQAYSPCRCRGDEAVRPRLMATGV